MTSMIDMAIEALIEKRLKDALARYHTFILHEIEAEDDRPNRRGPMETRSREAYEFVRGRCSPHEWRRRT